jgi:RNA polymerase sigma factor (sigma-70 family)
MTYAAKSSKFLSHGERQEPGTAPSDATLLSRFLKSGDSNAFDTLIRRHGPLVLSICRRHLRDSNDVDDAFQATFIVMLKKAKSIRNPRLLSNWLFGVASRVARKMRAQRLRQVTGEGGAEAVTMHEEQPQYDANETGRLIHEELASIAEVYRAPLVLCYLDGKTHVEAAILLGCPLGSLADRLEKGRRELKRRMLQRGVVLSAAFLAVWFTEQRASAEVSEVLIASTVERAIAWSNRRKARRAEKIAASMLPTDGPGNTARRFPRLLRAGLLSLLLITVGVTLFAVSVEAVIGADSRRAVEFSSRWANWLSKEFDFGEPQGEALKWSWGARSDKSGLKERNARIRPGEDPDDGCKRCIGTRCG